MNDEHGWIDNLLWLLAAAVTAGLLWAGKGAAAGWPHPETKVPREVGPFVRRGEYHHRLEPRGNAVLHGAGQSDITSFAHYRDALGEQRPMLTMSYVDLNDDIAQATARLRDELGRYPELLVPQIGVSMNGGDAAKHYEAEVAAGKRDAALAQLCDGLQALDRPVFLRVGYEFNGPWNGYDAAAYAAAFRHVAERMRSCLGERVAMVWDWSPEAAADRRLDADGARAQWSAYYPGDAWVDWWGLNLFTERSIASAATAAFLSDAALRRFPVMIAESAPKGHMTVEGQGLVAAWMVPYFALIHRSPAVKAFCYINWDWRGYLQWKDWGDSRIEQNVEVLEWYRREMRATEYAHGRGRAETMRLLGVR